MGGFVNKEQNSLPYVAVFCFNSYSLCMHSCIESNAGIFQGQRTATTTDDATPRTDTARPGSAINSPNNKE